MARSVLCSGWQTDPGCRPWPRTPPGTWSAGKSATTLLAERCRRGIESRGLEATREVEDRLNAEIAMIHKLGYSAYFLTVADIAADIRTMGIRCACRGSAAGSLVCYLTRIS